MTLRPLTAELDDKNSPVRRFLDDRFSVGLRDVQRRYRQAAPSLVVPSAPRQEANPGTVGTAADWLLRFLLHPKPSLALASAGADLCGMDDAFTDIAISLGYGSGVAPTGVIGFTGPVSGSTAQPEELARACWALALLTEMFRNPMAAINGPLGMFGSRQVSGDALLSLTPPAALNQLAEFRSVFEVDLLPRLASYAGRWYLGPTFTGSALMKADADLITAGLLLDLKTDSKFSLGVTVLFQVIGYALLDVDDAYALTELGIFSARYAQLAIWDLSTLLDELAVRPVNLATIRQEFHELLSVLAYLCAFLHLVNGCNNIQSRMSVASARLSISNTLGCHFVFAMISRRCADNVMV